MANSVDQDQTAPIGAVCSWSMLFASIINLSVMQGIYLQQTTFSDAFFLGALRVKISVFVLNRCVASCHPTKCDVITCIKLFPTAYCRYTVKVALERG